MTRKVSFIYSLGLLPDLYTIAENETQLKAVLDSIQETHPGVKISYKRGPRLAEAKQNSTVSIQELTEGSLDAALETYVPLTKKPDYIGRGSDFSAVERVYQDSDQGYELIKPILTFGLGPRKVVPENSGLTARLV
jgi:hypothetical protein